jgi:enoyl-CoA hydratase/carnithine racemase
MVAQQHKEENMNDAVLYRKEDGVAIVTLNRPERLNAITDEIRAGLKEKLDDACKDNEVNVIVLTGAGRGFCAGADMDGLAATSKGESNQGLEAEERNYSSNNTKGFEGGFSYFPTLPKPVIAAINGPAAGVGFIMALYCDIRFAKESAVFTSAFSKRGLIAEWGVGWILPRLVGLARANDILFSARRIDGLEAEKLGIVNKTFSDETFDDEVMTYAKNLAKSVSPRSVRIMKEQIYNAQGETIKENLDSSMTAMLESFESDDFKEGVAHYMEKREPKFTGK